MTVSTPPDFMAADAKHELARAAQLVGEQSRIGYLQADRLFAWLLGFQWLAAVAAAVWMAGSRNLSAIEAAWWGTLLGTLVSGIPLWLITHFSGSVLTRHAVAVAQIVWASLLMEFTGGHLGSHIPVFGSIAVLACYRDWRVLLTATVIFVLRDVGRGTLWPLDSPEAVREWERMVFVMFEFAALTLAIRLSGRENWLLAVGQAQLEETNRLLDAEYRDRSTAYRQYTERLEHASDELRAQAFELQQARRAAEEANAAKSRLVATVSHEIRTPLSAILGFTDVLLANLGDAESSRAARTIKRNGEFLLHLVDDILDLSKIESGNLTVESLRCWPRQIVSEVTQLMKIRAESKGLRIVVECDPDMPTTIYSDPLRLRQILLNLVSNAIKFSSRGIITIRIAPATGGMLQLQVSDQGIGLTPRQVENLFSPFTQGDASTSRLYGGSGLGLWISKRLANLLGGDITVHSAPGQGSTFVVTVATQGAQPPQHTEQPQIFSAAKHNAAVPVPHIAGRRVLVADDSPDGRELATFVLERCGAEVSAVNHGDAAVREALAANEAGQPFDVILMDVQMPGLDGFTATERLRAEGYGGIVVALTAHARPEELQRSRQSGCDACLSKPIDASLLSLMEQLIGQRAAKEPLAVSYDLPSSSQS